MKRLIITLLLLGLSVFIGFKLIKYFFIENSIEKYTDVINYDKYKKELIKNLDVQSSLYIFPENVELDNVVKFNYMKEDGLFEGGYILFLEYQYDNDSYKKEIERLKEIRSNILGNQKKILYTEDGFNYPAYITIFDGIGSYEYALVDRDNLKIIYVFDQILNINEIDEVYRPVNYKVPVDNRDIKKSGFNIYYHYDYNGTGINIKEV